MKCGSIEGKGQKYVGIIHVRVGMRLYLAWAFVSVAHRVVMGRANCEKG